MGIINQHRKWLTYIDALHAATHPIDGSNRGECIIEWDAFVEGHGQGSQRIPDIEITG